MQSKSATRISMVAIAMTVCLALSGASAMAQSAIGEPHDGRCSNQTLLAIMEAKLKVRSSAPICLSVA
jgi:hypothetical protein